MGNKQNIPKLRFPGFEGEWEMMKLGEVAELTSSKRVYANDYVENGIPFYRGKEITELKENKKPTDILYISNEAYATFKKSFGVPQVNDILITAVGTIGNILTIKKNTPFYFKDGNLIWLRKINQDCNFLEILLYYNNKEIEKSAIGSSQKALTMVELRKLFFSYPSLPEQQKIASFFTAIDTKLAQLKKKKQLLEQYKKGVMQKIFSQELRFKPVLSEVEGDENGKEFPDWEERKLGDVAFKKSSNIAANTIEDNFGDFVIYGASGVLKKVDFYMEEEEYISIVKDGAGVGRVFLCSNKSSVLGTLDILKPSENVDLFFLFCLLANIDFVKYTTGSTIPHIYFRDYKNEVISIPSLPEQQKIASFLTAIDNKIALVSEALEDTGQWKKGLLQRMFC